MRRRHLAGIAAAGAATLGAAISVLPWPVEATDEEPPLPELIGDVADQLERVGDSLSTLDAKLAEVDRLLAEVEAR